MKTQVTKEDKKLILTREFDAPPELMFKVWSDCKHLKHWWGPKEWPMKECEMDFREGGEWHYCLRGPKQEDVSWGLAKYKSITKPKKILYMDYFSDEDRNINQEMPGMEILVEFKPHNGKTLQVNTTTFSSNEERDKIHDMGVAQGMESSSLRLDEYLKEVQ
ncbi:SRPBCC domain-containing protein [Gracilimonas tropica]|uniref:SRPBCC domain-containing protein n=1 Tax=Gracilimonas tropica TaxID=454600 RepID=UPI0003773A54|nr:SRPBCC domain-containing protein [Gracilimonas tropica]